MNYSVVGPDGFIVLSQITDSPNYPIIEGNRLLPDEIPQCDNENEIIHRVEPVLPEHTKIEYRKERISDSVKANQIISQRNARLKESDNHMFIDLWESYSDIQKQEWKEYRQALRDITSQEGFPWNVEWPIPPSVFVINKI
jgi:hypothetical protein